MRAAHLVSRAGFALLAASVAGVAVAAADVQRDKRQHFFVSAALGAAGVVAARRHGAQDCEAARIGIAFTVAIGAGKEWYDLRIKRTHWDWGDLLWDVAGAAVGSLAASGCL